MRPRKKIRRQRCKECGEWYLPDRRAGLRQETCSTRCRLGRRRRQAKERRGKDIERYRAAELARQRKCREKTRREAGGPDPPGVAELAEGERDELEAVVALALTGRVSRAALVEALLKLVNSVVESKAG